MVADGETRILSDLGWIQAQVSRRLGPMLRQREETQDYVQAAMSTAGRGSLVGWQAQLCPKCVIKPFLR